MYGVRGFCLLAALILWAPVVSLAAVAVPSVVGMDQVAAQGELQALGLVAAVNTQYSADYPKGQVFMQSPVSGSVVEPGSTVTLTVSLGFDPQIYSLQGLIYALYGIASGVCFTVGFRGGACS